MSEGWPDSGVRYLVFKNFNQFRSIAESKEAWIFNQIYNSWKQNWTSTFQSLKSSHRTEPNEFLRQSYITAFAKDDDLVGFILITIFDTLLQCHLEHPYLQRFPSKFLANQTSVGMNRFASLEYLFVQPEWRKKKTGVCYAELLTVLGAQLAFDEGVHQCLAVARKDRGVSDFLTQRKAIPLMKEIDLHNVKVDLLVIYPQTFNFELDTGFKSQQENFWNQRIVYTASTINQSVA